MNQYVTGAVIKELREKYHFTQAKLAEKMNDQNGDIVIPIYLGGTMLDEVIVNAQQRMNLRSGGR